MEAVFGLDKLFSATVTSFATLTTLVAVIWTFRFSLTQRKKLPPWKIGLPFTGESISFFRAHKHNNIGKWIEERTIKVWTSIQDITHGMHNNRFIFSGRNNGIAAKLATSALAILGKNSTFDLHGSPHKLVRSAIMSS
nr:taxadiene 5-alpha hydroxylase-like [Populus alba]